MRLYSHYSLLLCPRTAAPTNLRSVTPRHMKSSRRSVILLLYQIKYISHRKTPPPPLPHPKIIQPCLQDHDCLTGLVLFRKLSYNWGGACWQCFVMFRWLSSGLLEMSVVEYNHLIIPIIIIIIIIHLWLPGLDFLLLSNLTGTNYSEITPSTRPYLS